MALRISHISTSRGRPPGIEAGIISPVQFKLIASQVAGISFTHVAHGRAVYLFAAYTE